MMTSQECEKNPKENYENNLIILSVKKYDTKSKKYFYKNEPLHFRTRKCKEASQVIRMSEEAYEYMTSSTYPEWWTNPSMWKRMSKEKRLELHLDRLCKHLGGISYTYAVYND
jgi:hypothetical protein